MADLIWMGLYTWTANANASTAVGGMVEKSLEIILLLTISTALGCGFFVSLRAREGGTSMVFSNKNPISRLADAESVRQQHPCNGACIPRSGVALTTAPADRLNRGPPALRATF